MTATEIIPCKAIWFDGNGLPVNLIPWITQEFHPAEKEDTIIFSGRCIGDKFCNIRVTIPSLKSERGITARVDLPDGKYYQVSSGQIHHYDSGILSKCWIKYGIDDNFEWRLDWEMVRKFHRIYGKDELDCPAILGHASAQIDKLLYSLLGKEGRFYFNPFISLFNYKFTDLSYCKSTPPEIRFIYRWITQRFQHEERVVSDENRENTKTSGKELALWYKSFFRAVVTNGKIGTGKSFEDITKAGKSDYGMCRSRPNVVVGFHSELNRYIPIGSFDDKEDARKWLELNDPLSLLEIERFLTTEEFKEVVDHAESLL